jgi:hypothetical protein
MDKQKIIVVFRKFTKFDDIIKTSDDIIALFPYEEETYQGLTGYCTCYQHVGQHGTADYQACINMSVAATPQEYGPLAKELESIGYELIIRLKKTNKRK